MTKLLEHKHLMIRSEVRHPPKDIEKMNAWMINTVESIGMTILDGPRTLYSDMVGNRGLTSSVILNTSNLCVHTWDEVDPGLMMIDLYTCGSLDIEVIFKLIEEFQPVKIDYMFIDREHYLNVLDYGKKE